MWLYGSLDRRGWHGIVLLMNCPQCDNKIAVTTESAKGFIHIYESCSYCGYIKAYVDYLDSDTGPVNWSGIDH